MAQANRVFKGDVGTVIKIDVGVDLTNATVLKIKYIKPVSKRKGEWVASVNVNEPTKLVYIVQEGDLDEAGTWILQPYIEFSDWKGRGSKVFLEVEE